MTRPSHIAIFFAAITLLVLPCALNVAAAPPTQNPTPTEEPTKRPYVFPTPIFIATFISATDLPPRSATSIRATAPPAATLPPPAPGTTAQPSPTVAPADLALDPDETETPVPEPEPDTAILARAAEQALYAMSVVLFLGFIVISGTAWLIYRRNQRADKITAIKQRLKSK